MILVVKLMALAIPGPESTGFALPMMVMAGLIAVFFYRYSCEWAIIFRIFPVTAIGVGLGYLVMDSLPKQVFNPVLGGIILGMLIVG